MDIKVLLGKKIQEIRKSMEEKVKLKWTNKVQKIVGIVIEQDTKGLHQPQLTQQTMQKVEARLNNSFHSSSKNLHSFYIKILSQAFVLTILVLAPKKFSRLNYLNFFIASKVFHYV